MSKSLNGKTVPNAAEPHHTHSVPSVRVCQMREAQQAQPEASSYLTSALQKEVTDLNSGHELIL
jgi:hypothetical protein